MLQTSDVTFCFPTIPIFPTEKELRKEVGQERRHAEG
jgi:hypothetical protein